jgi:RNA polymerase sigma-70 factor (ECF subfamily)
MSVDCTLDSQEEAALVDDARRGNPLALRRLVDVHRHRVTRFLLRHAITPAEAEELAQDVFLEAFRSLASFEGRSRYLSWLTGIAHNRVRNYVTRTPWRRHEVPLDPALEAADLLVDPRNGSNPEQAVAINEAVAALMKCIALLPPAARDALLRVGVDELTLEQAAARTGEPLGSLKSRVSRTRKTLRSRLSPDHFDALAGRS